VNAATNPQLKQGVNENWMASAQKVGNARHFSSTSKKTMQIGETRLKLLSVA
jgi:hypothetical protein